GQRALYFFKLLFDAVNDAQGVLAIAHDDNATDYLALAVEFRDSAAYVGAQMDRAHIFHIDRGALLRFEWDVLDVLDVLDIATTAHVILGRSDFEDFPADVAVGHAYFVNDFGYGNAVGEQFIGINVHLVLLHEAANGRDFGDPLD